MAESELVQSLLARVEELEAAEMRRIRDATAAHRADVDAQSDEPISRRHLLRNLGGAAAAGVGMAAGASVLAPAPAAAASGTWQYGTNTRIDAGEDGSGLRSNNASKTLVVENYGEGAALAADSPKTAVHATSDSNSAAIWATAHSQASHLPAAIVAEASPLASGLFAIAEHAPAIYGISDGTPNSFESEQGFDGTGVLGVGAVGLRGQSHRADGVALRLGASLAPAANTLYRAGSFSWHSTRGLLHCTKDGRPGTWSRVGYNPINPFRLVDTRDTGGPIGANSHRLFTVAPAGTGEDAIPTSAAGIILNVTAVGPTASGFVTVFPSNVSVANWPSAGAPYSTVNFAVNQVAANQTTVKIGPDGKVGVFNRNGSVHVVIDVMGFFS